MTDNDLGDWFRSIPIVTRWWFALSVLFPVAGRFGLVNMYYMFLDFGQIVYRFQFWRLLTCLVFYPITPMTGFHYLINLYFLYNYGVRLESGFFDGRPADFLFMIIVMSLVLIIIGLVMSLYLLMDALVLAVLFVWCQINRDTIVQFWFGIEVKAMYLPWIIAGFEFIIRGGGVVELFGILAGHLYFFLMFKYPQDFGGRQFIWTPSILYKLLPNRRGGVSGFGVAPSSRAAPRDDDRQHRWPGGGQRLGQD